MKNKIFISIFVVLGVFVMTFAIAKMYVTHTQGSVSNTESSNRNLKVVIYSKTGCIYCMKAQSLLEQKQIKYEKIELSNNQDLHLKLINQTGQETVPYIFINDNFIGGFEELNNLDKDGKL